MFLAVRADSVFAYRMHCTGAASDAAEFANDERSLLKYKARFKR